MEKEFRRPLCDARPASGAGCALSLCDRVRRPSLPGDDCSIYLFYLSVSHPSWRVRFYIPGFPYEVCDRRCALARDGWRPHVTDHRPWRYAVYMSQLALQLLPTTSRPAPRPARPGGLAATSHSCCIDTYL